MVTGFVEQQCHHHLHGNMQLKWAPNGAHEAIPTQLLSLLPAIMEFTASTNASRSKWGVCQL